MIITIDGPAGSGKSTVARMLAQKLGFVHFNSGSLYRGITAYAIKHSIPTEELNEKSTPLDLRLKYIEGVQHVFVNKEDMTEKLRDNEVSILTPTISVIPYIRDLIDNCQRKFGNSHDIVADGRDVGSFVFPNAKYKFYLDCDINERANRRYKEEVLKNPNITLEEIKYQIQLRDETDKKKAFAPLVIPDNAIIIDSTHLTATEEVNKMLGFIYANTQK